MEVYRIDEERLSRVPAGELSTEQELEEHLIKSRGATIGGIELMYIDRQGSPEEGGIFDILAVDRDGDLVVVELKRDKTPRDIVAQALEYAAGLRNDDYETLDDRFQQFLRSHGLGDDEDERPTLQEAHAEYFDREDDAVPTRAFNTEQRLVLVGREFRSVSLNMADFLRAHDIDVVCVEYQSFVGEGDGLRLLTTQPIRRPLNEEPSGTSDDGGESRAGKIKREFWELVSEKLGPRGDTPLSRSAPRAYYAKNHPTSRSDVKIRTAIRTVQQEVSVMLLIRDDRELYDRLKASQKEIEAKIDEPVTRVPHEETQGDKERCKVAVSRGIDIDERTDWDEAAEWMIDRAELFFEIFDPRLAE